MKTGKIVVALTALALVFLSHMANATPSPPLKAEQPRRISIYPRSGISVFPEKTEGGFAPSFESGRWFPLPCMQLHCEFA